MTALHILVVISSLLMGCAESVRHEVAPEHLATLIVIGQTHKDEVRHLLGSPHWDHKFPSAAQANESWSYWYTPRINKLQKYFLSEGASTQQTDPYFEEAQIHGVRITFSEDGLVQSVSRQTSKRK